MQGVEQGSVRPVNERKRIDSVWPAALRATAPVASIAAVGLTVLIYLVSVNILELVPTSEAYVAFSGDAAVVAGLVLAVILWLIVAAAYRGYTSAQSANRRNFNLLSEKLDRLDTRAWLALHEGYEPEEWWEDRPGSGVLRAMRYQALEQVKHECEEIRKGLKGKGMPWVTGLGYIELWHRVHRAEEALIKVEPYPDALEGAMRDESRLMNANMANRDTLLKRLNCAIAVLDESKTCHQLNYLSGTDGECSLPPPNERKRPANVAKALAILSDVRYEINHFRDSVWEGIVNARNRLADTSVLLGFAAYALLGLAIFSDAPHDTITWVITYFLIGAITGLFARAQAEWNADTAVDDFGLATARLLQIPWLSGLAAVGGVLITSVIDGSFAGSKQGTELIAIFDSRPILFIIAAVFGLTPDLIIRRLQQQVDKYKDDLQSTQSSQSDEDASRTAGTRPVQRRTRTA
jgi:hypothetical protein